MSEPLLTPVDTGSGTATVDDPTEHDAPRPSQEPGAEHDEPVSGEAVQGMIPGRSRRRTKLERGSMRVLATGGIIGIATALGAVLVGNDVAGWIVGLAIGLTSVVLAALLWSSRQL
jgi:hypothetical protein